MITAEKLKVLIDVSTPELTKMARWDGYRGPAFSSSKFLGISTGQQLVYMAVFLVDPGKSHDTDSTKVFVSLDGMFKTEVDGAANWQYN